MTTTIADLGCPVEGRVVTAGWLKNNLVRRARKRHRCDCWRGSVAGGGRCKLHIEPGDVYVEGDPNEEAGGYGRDRYCARCVRESYLEEVEP